MPPAFLTVKLSPDEYLPAEYIQYVVKRDRERDRNKRTLAQSTVEFITYTHTPPEARVPNLVTVCENNISITVPHNDNEERKKRRAE